MDCFNIRPEVLKKTQYWFKNPPTPLAGGRKPSSDTQLFSYSCLLVGAFGPARYGQRRRGAENQFWHITS